jgi:hypothetical protein
MGFNLLHWLSGAAKVVGTQIEHAATGIVSIAKAVIHQPIELAHTLSATVLGVSHDLSGTAKSLGHSADDALKGVSSNLTMPLMVAGGAALVFMMTQRR